MHFHFESRDRHSDVVNGSSVIKKYPAPPFYENLLLRAFFRGLALALAFSFVLVSSFFGAGIAFGFGVSFYGSGNR